MNEKLKPCPFCGGVVSVTPCYNINKGIDDIIFHCKYCGLEYIVYSITQWNTRPVEDEMYQILERQCNICKLKDHETECDICEIGEVLRKIRGEQ